MKDRKHKETPRTTTTSGHDTELRRRVEQHLTRRPSETGGAEGDGLRLLQELQIHQIELQTQNVELQNARDEMEALLEKYSDLYDFAPVGYLTLDRAGSIVEVNLTGAGLLGVERSGLLKRRFRPFVATVDEAALEHLLERAFASGTRETCEVALRREAGQPPVETRLEAVAGPDERGCRVAMIEITGQKRAERDRLILGKLESTGVLAAGLAHDFNNLLTVILLNLEPGGTPAANDPVLGQRLVAAKQAALSAAGLTRQLITFAVGGASIRRVTPLPSLLREAVAPVLSGSNVRGDFKLADDLWSVEVDAGQIDQVIRNLVWNAREAMPDGGVVRLEAEDVILSSPTTTGLQPGEYVWLRVIDAGRGIAPEALPSVFDPYFSTKQRGGQKGMGLGLAICHSIIKNHGGAITLESARDTGTTVHVHLPAATARKKNPPDRESAPPRPPASPRCGKFLVMDDEAQVCVVLGAILERMHHEVELVPDGAMAVDAYRRALAAGRPFDAVLLDLTVKDGMGARDALAALREIDPGVSAIVMSGYAEDPVLLEHARYGFKGALAKPFKLENLRELLSRVMKAGKEPGTTP